MPSLCAASRRVGDLNRQIQQIFQFHGAAGDGVLQRLAVQKLHGDERLPFRLADIVNRADVGMVQGGRGLRFSLETRQRLRVFRDVVRQEFQRDKTVQAGILGFVHHAHASAAEAFYDAIVGEGLREERIVAGHVQHILGCEKTQVNEERFLAFGILLQQPQSRACGQRLPCYLLRGIILAGRD